MSACAIPRRRTSPDRRNHVYTRYYLLLREIRIAATRRGNGTAYGSLSPLSPSLSLACIYLARRFLPIFFAFRRKSVRRTGSSSVECVYLCVCVCVCVSSKVSVSPKRLLCLSVIIVVAVQGRYSSTQATPSERHVRLIEAFVSNRAKGRGDGTRSTNSAARKKNSEFSLSVEFSFSLSFFLSFSFPLSASKHVSRLACVVRPLSRGRAIGIPRVSTRRPDIVGWRDLERERRSIAFSRVTRDLLEACWRRGERRDNVSEELRTERDRKRTGERKKKKKKTRERIVSLSPRVWRFFHRQEYGRVREPRNRRPSKQKFSHKKERKKVRRVNCERRVTFAGVKREGKGREGKERKKKKERNLEAGYEGRANLEALRAYEIVRDSVVVVPSYVTGTLTEFSLLTFSNSLSSLLVSSHSRRDRRSR